MAPVTAHSLVKTAQMIMMAVVGMLNSEQNEPVSNET